MDTDLKARLMRLTVKTPDCWIWRGSRNQKGYGRMRASGSGPLLSVHRVSYELFVGPIPEGLEIDHLCRTRYCVRPSHLEAVTHIVNIQRGITCTKTHCKQGHLLDGLSKRGRFCRTCGRTATAKWYRENRAHERRASPNCRNAHRKTASSWDGRRCIICRNAGARRRWASRKVEPLDIAMGDDTRCA